MKEFYQFASDSPFLTFFLFVIVGQTIIGIVGAITRCFS